MKFIKHYLAYLLLCLIFSCISSDKISNGISSNDQCEILAKKRMASTKKTDRRIRSNSGKENRRPKIVEVVMTDYAKIKLEVPKRLEPLFGLGEGPIMSKGIVLIPRNVTNTHPDNMPTKDIIPKESAVVNNLQTKSDSPKIRIFSNIRKANNENMSVAKNSDMPMWLGIAGLLSMLLVSRSKSKLINLSRWAMENPWKTRGIIAGIQAATASASFGLGFNLAEQGLMVSADTNMVAGSIFIASALMYPKANYLQKKMYDAALFTAGTAMVLGLGNQYYPTNENIFENETSYNLANFTHFSHSMYQMEADHSFNDEPQKKEMKKGVKALLLFLAIAGFVGLTVLLGGLSCNIACSGSEGLAFFVFTLGEVGLIALLVTAIRGIFGRRKGRNKNKVEVNT